MNTRLQHPGMHCPCVLTRLCLLHQVAYAENQSMFLDSLMGKCFLAACASDPRLQQAYVAVPDIRHAPHCKPPIVSCLNLEGRKCWCIDAGDGEWISRYALSRWGWILTRYLDVPMCQAISTCTIK